MKHTRHRMTTQWPSSTEILTANSRQSTARKKSRCFHKRGRKT